MGSWFDTLYSTFIEDKYYELILEGFGNTILITLGAVVIGVLIGILIPVVKYLGEDSKMLK
ncbi:MAG: amino acid ABC transporter permease, partial [Clostridia bacterium]|nr:amino acid ABC transporter permease [Clostridia bacterium]